MNLIDLASHDTADAYEFLDEDPTFDPDYAFLDDPTFAPTHTAYHEHVFGTVDDCTRCLDCEVGIWSDDALLPCPAR